MSRATPEQVQSIQPDSHIWVMASAGSGKTHVLSQRVLRLLLDGERPESILCLTFTKAAAAEMSTRVFKSLAEMVHKDDAALAAQLADMGVSAAQAGHARTLFARTLDARGGLKIQTIHAFCQSLLARYPLEAELPPGFGTLDDQKALAWQREALEAQMRDGRLKADWARLAGIRQDGSLIADVADYARALDDSDAAENATRDGLLPRIRTALGLPRAGDAQSWLQQQIADGAIDLNLINHSVSIWQKSASKNQLGNLARISLWMQESGTAHFNALMRGFSNADGELPSERTCTEKGAKDLDPDIYAKACEVHAQLKPLADTLTLFTLADETATLARVCLGMVQFLRLQKHAQGLISFSDLVRKAGLLMQDPLAQWVLYKMDDKIRHILVDESQDTSSLQWRIIDAIAAEFFVGQSAAKAGRTIFAVGDDKQSIYGFQGSEPDLFHAKRLEYETKSANAAMSFLEVPLSLSFRSSPAVIDFVNATMAHIGDATLGLQTPAKAHAAFRRDRIGSVTLWQAIEAEAAEALIANVAEDLLAPWRPAAEQLLAFRIADQIEAWLSGADALAVRDQNAGARAVQAGDILILVQKRSALMTTLVSALKAKGIAVAGVDRIKLLDQLAVKDVLTAVQFVLLPEDDLNLACLLKSPFIGLSEAQLLNVCTARGTASLWSQLKSSDDPQCIAAHAWLEAQLSRADQMLPFVFLSRLLDDPTGRARLLAALGEEAADPLSMLMDAALRYEQENVPSLQGFLHWLGQQASDIKRDPDQARGQVRLMTVHGAKGLEAPVVIIADACARPRGQRAIINVAGVPIWYRSGANKIGPVAAAVDAQKQREAEEYWRLYYVAITRAADHLFITGWQSKKNGTDKVWYDAVQESLEQVGAAPQLHAHWGTIWRTGDVADAPAPRDLAPASPRRITAILPAPAEPTPGRPLSPSRLAEAPVPRVRLALANPENRARGVAIHRMLELLPEVPADQRADVAAQLAPRLGLDSASTAQVLAVLAAPDFAEIFSSPALAEAPVSALLPDGSVLSGQIDRLLIRADEILIVDYKSGSQIPATPDEVPTAYLRQMAAYRWALRRIWNRPVRAALLWTEAAQLMPLADTLLDVYTPEQMRS
jgi:ATP-dependent helicase/nuclease subunit A